MNKVILMGRLTRDPEVRYSQNGSNSAVCRYSLAVDRSYKREGEPTADYINCVAFGRAGEFSGKYFKKGMMVAIVGELRTGSYVDREGNKRYTTDVVVSEQHFAESKAAYESRMNSAGSGNSSDFAPRPNYDQQSRQDGGSNQKKEYTRPQPQANDGFTPIDDDMEEDADLPF